MLTLPRTSRPSNTATVKEDRGGGGPVGSLGPVLPRSRVGVLFYGSGGSQVTPERSVPGSGSYRIWSGPVVPSPPWNMSRVVSLDGRWDEVPSTPTPGSRVSPYCLLSSVGRRRAESVPSRTSGPFVSEAGVLCPGPDRGSVGA